MVNYGKGAIYRIICNITGEQYIGSSCVGLSQRLAEHRNDFKRWNNGKRGYTTSFQILERGNYSIVLVEEFPCNNKEQLCFRERYWIEQLDCINKMKRPVITTEERIERRKKNNKEYRQTNREHITNIRKKYYEANKVQITENYNINKVQIADKHKAKITCICGSVCRVADKSRHEKSLKHQRYLEDNNKNVAVNI